MILDGKRFLPVFLLSLMVLSAISGVSAVKNTSIDEQNVFVGEEFTIELLTPVGGFNELEYYDKKYLKLIKKITIVNHDPKDPKNVGLAKTTIYTFKSNLPGSTIIKTKSGFGSALKVEDHTRVNIYRMI